MKVDDLSSQPFSQPLLPSSSAPAEAAPTLPLMHFAHVLTGFATVLLGPILPLLIRHWHLSDAHAGLLPLAQFAGATLGGITVSPRLARSLLVGLLAGFLGFCAFAFAPGLPFALVGLLLGGFGAGRSIAAINILGGMRSPIRRGAALARLNFTWSLGALLSPLAAATLTTRLPLVTFLATFALLFLLCAAALLLQVRAEPHAQVTLSEGAAAPQSKNPQDSPRPHGPSGSLSRSPSSSSPSTSETAAPASFARSLFLYFAVLLFIYGGLETCLNVWLTTYALRYGQTSLVLSQYTLVLLLAGLTAGRAFAAWLLLRFDEAFLQRIALALSAVLAAALTLAHQPSLIAALAVLLGFTLAPVFPATFALFMANRPPARSAGIVLAASGIGAASLPWLLGVLSTASGSLRTALAIPIATALLMLALTFAAPRFSNITPGG